VKAPFGFDNLIVRRGDAIRTEICNIDGISIILTHQDARGSDNYNAWDKRKDMVISILDIGCFIEKNIDRDNYNPLKHGLHGLLDFREYGSFEELKDTCFVFFHEDSARNRLLEMLSIFVSSFGQPSLGREYDDMWNQAFYALCKKTSSIPDSPFFTIHAGIVLNEIYNIYYYYRYPKAYAKKMLGGSPENYTALDFNIIGNAGFDGVKWYPRYIITPLNAAKFMIISISTSDTEHIRQCTHCENFFVTDNSRAVYCSPTCRNRANVKKSYERKKLREKGDD